VRKAWEQTTLGEVVSFKGGGTPSTEKPAYWNGDVPWVSPKDMKSSEIGDSIDKITMEAIENSAASLIPKDAILIVVRSGILARTIPVAMTTRALAVNQDIKALCPNKDVSPRYLHYFMQMSEPDILKLVTRGATVHRLSTDSLRALTFPKPPLPEQQRIIGILDEAFAGLAITAANIEKNLKNAHELFDSQLSRMFEKATERHGSRRLADIVSRLTNGYVGPTRNIYLKNGVPYLLARHVRDNRLEFDGRTFVSDKFNEKNKKSKLKVGDVLLVQSGHIGHSAVVGPEHEGHNCHAMIVITPVPDQLSGSFLSFYFGTVQMKKKFEEIRSGSTVPHLTCGLVRELLIPLPKVDEQQKLVAAFKELEEHTSRLASLATAKILSVTQLKRSILQKAFSGELTSPPSQAIREAAE
jgi:type I restriction enzyme S subunit